MAKNNSRTRDKRESQEIIDLELSLIEKKRANIDIQLQKINFLPGTEMKNDNQKKLIRKIHENQIIFVKGPAGVGKAQPLDAKILTPNGWITMGELKVGDEVISVDGKSTEVFGIFPQGEKEIFKVIFSDGTSTECCKEHLWSTKTYADRNSRKRKKDRSRYKDEKPGSVKSLEEIMNSLKTNRGDKNHLIPIVNPISFSYKELPIDSYVLGCLIGDGCLLKDRVLFSSADEEIIENITIRINNRNKINKFGKQYDYSIVKENRSILKNEILESLKNLDLSGKKSYDKFIPEIYKFSSIEQRLNLLRGLMDTDGTVDKSGHRISFTTVSKKLSEDVISLVQSLGGICYIKEKLKKYTYKGEKKVGRLAYQITICMNPDMNPFLLSRKANKVVAKTKYKPKRFIVDVIPVGKKQAQCIMVDHPSRLYITDDFIVTHNTYIAIKAALECLKVNDSPYAKMLITKPLVEGGDQNMGFLPGDVKEKTEPWMKSYESNICKLVGDGTAKSLMDSGVIKSLAFPLIRGNTFDNSIAILDEGQNTTIGGMKLFLSRIGETSKIIVLGDVDQTDLKLRRGEKTGLEDAFERFKGVPGVAYMEFNEDDIVRSSILIELMKRYRIVREG